MDQSMFTQVVTALLKGDMICEETLPGGYAFLEDSRHREAVGDYLMRLDRAVRATSDQRGYFCAYVRADDPETVTAARRTFRLVANDLEALVQWLRLARDCHPTSRPLEAGMDVYESEFLGCIEQSPELAHALNDLTKHALFKSSASAGRGQLGYVFNKLVEKGYFIRLDSAGTRFRATAQWSYLYDVLSFLCAHERLELDPDNEEQSSLF